MHSMTTGSKQIHFLLALTLAGLCSGCSDEAATGKQSDAALSEGPLPVRVAYVEGRELRRTIESVGSLFPFEEVTVSSEVEGKVDQVLVDVGDRVNTGQPLVRVSTVELSLAVEQQNAALAQARARLGLSAEGEDLQDLRNAAEVKKAAADLSDAQLKYQRAQRLLKQGLLPREIFDESESRYKAATAAYELAVQAVQNLRAQVAEYEAGVALAQKKLKDAVIRAPFAGQVKERTVTPGQYLAVQTPVVVIVNVDPLRVRLKVPERMSGWVGNSEAVTLSVEAYPDRTFSGKVWRVNPSVDQQTRSFDVEALVSNPQNLLKPGFFVKAQIPSERVDRILLVPQEAVSYTYGVYKVFLVEGNTLREHEVRIGERSGQDIEIVAGLKQGQGVALPHEGVALRDQAVIEVVP
jgi:RND family efflux transporter MFP subunit